MYFLAASVASLTCVSRAACDAIPFANWVRRVMVRLNTLVKKHSEQHSNSQHKLKKNHKNPNHLPFSLSALDVKTKPEEDCLSTWRETSRLIDDTYYNKRPKRFSSIKKIWFLPDAEPPSSQKPTAIKGSETCLLKGWNTFTWPSVLNRMDFWIQDTSNMLW